MIVTTEAIVLRTRKYRETSVIATLYTRAFGKISVIAKGARDRKSKFGSSLQPMNHVRAVMYLKDTRELQLLSQCDIVESFSGLSDDLDRMTPALSAVELVDLTIHAEEENQPLFRLLADVLRTANSATKNGILALYYFEAKLLDILGFRPELGRCAGCGLPLDGTAEVRGKADFRMSPGGLFCQGCSSRGLGLERVSPAAVRVLQRLQALTDPEAATRIALSKGVRGEVAAALRKYLETHVEGLQRRKADAVFAALSEMTRLREERSR